MMRMASSKANTSSRLRTTIPTWGLRVGNEIPVAPGGLLHNRRSAVGIQRPAGQWPNRAGAGRAAVSANMERVGMRNLHLLEMRCERFLLNIQSLIRNKPSLVHWIFGGMPKCHEGIGVGDVRNLEGAEISQKRLVETRRLKNA